jgi:hypothetical protein
MNGITLLDLEIDGQSVALTQEQADERNEQIISEVFEVADFAELSLQCVSNGMVNSSRF